MVLDEEAFLMDRLEERYFRGIIYNNLPRDWVGLYGVNLNGLTGEEWYSALVQQYREVLREHK